jgi:hypothetical protein
MTRGCGRIQTDKSWALCLMTLMMAFYVALEDTMDLVTIVPYLAAVAYTLCWAAMSHRFSSPLVKFEHGRLDFRRAMSRDAIEITLSRIDHAEFHPYWKPRSSVH